MSEQWQKVKEILQAALEYPSDEREQFLDEVCGNDESLRREVETLLLSAENAGGFMEQAAIGKVAEMFVSTEENSLQMAEYLNHYRILSNLGAGGMGEVYLAEDTKLNRFVAIKLLPPSKSDDENANRRLLREARAAAALDHPHICHIHEIAETDGRSFIVMQFCEGETLAEKLEKGIPHLRETLDWAIQIADALDNAHSHRIIHRDIKPANIIVNRQGQAKILDFGLAKIIAERRNAESEAVTANMSSADNLIIGTAPYMSPEQMRGKLLDARTDIFSFGAMLYEMLSGKQVFKHESQAETIAAVLNYEPPIAKMLADEPLELQRIVRKCLAKEKEERYQAAKDLLLDLRGLQKRLEFEAEFGHIQSFDNIADAQTLVIKAETQTSIAVLPFVNLSGDAENDYFCDGLAEELLNALAKIDDLKVAARTSAFSFKDKNTNIGEIGKILNVKTILEGSVRKSGTRLRIIVQLINVADGFHLWSEKYDREMQNIFDVQDEITLAVVDALKMKLLGGKRSAVLKRYTNNSEAYELYLKGLYFYNKYNAEGWRKAIEYFGQTIEKEPEYAPAYIGIGLCYATLWFYCLLPLEKTVSKWTTNTNRALEIDENLSEAHYTLASFRFLYEWNWAEAEREYRRAIELKPNSPDAFWRLGLLLAVRERFDEAIVQAQKAIELDPLSLLVNLYAGYIYWFANRFDEAFAQVQKIIEIEPRFYGAYWFLGILHKTQGKYEDAIEAFQKSVALDGNQLILSILGDTYALAGKTDEASKILDQLLEMSKTQYIAAFNIARIYCGLGENEKAFQWLEKAFEERNGDLVFLNAQVSKGKEYMFRETIRNDPRFTSLLWRVGFQTDATAKIESANQTNESELENKFSPSSTAAPSSESRFDKTSVAAKKHKRLFIIGLIFSLIMAVGFGYWFFANRVANTKQIESIAVLPFTNESGNADVEYLSDGMTETLISSLSNIPNLNIKARSSVFRYKGKEDETQRIGKELNVEAILTGRIVQRGNELKLYITLIDVATEKVLWKSDYDRSMTNLVALQSDITRDVSDKLKMKLSGAVEQKLAKNYTENSEAYQLYLKGRFHLLKNTRLELQKGILYFQQAIAIDSTYAIAYVGLADAYRSLAFGGDLRPSEVMPQAKAAAKRAVEIDDTLGNAHAILGFIIFWYDRDWNEAESQFKRALELDPSNADTHLFYANLLCNTGRQADGLAEAKLSRELDPLDLRINALEAQLLLHAGQTDEALDRLRKSFALEPNFWLAHMMASSAYCEKGMYVQAVAEARKSRELNDIISQPIGFLGYALAKSGDRAGARAVLDELLKRSTEGYASPYSIALIYNGLDERDKVMNWLERGIEERDPRMTFLRVEPKWNNLHADPRFQELLRKVGFSQ